MSKLWTLPTSENNSRSSLQSRLDADSPPILSAGLDMWTEHHTGYMGINLHYLDKQWERVIFNLACAPFDISHTGYNIAQKLHSVMQDWKIEKQVGLCLRDNAANVTAAFNEENQQEYEHKFKSDLSGSSHRF